MNTFDDCELCGNVTASVTVRTTYDTTRVCSGCYTRHYDTNEESAVAWEAEFDGDIATMPTSEQAADDEAQYQAWQAEHDAVLPFGPDDQPAGEAGDPPPCEGCGEAASIEERDEDAGVSTWWCSDCWAEAMSHA